VIKLETNYRSRQPILEVANAVIAGSGSRRHEKTLRAARRGGDAVHVSSCESPQAEARFVAREIGRLRAAGRVPLEDVAVLYRSNLQSRLVEEELQAAGIPYRVYGGQQFFDRKEVKDVAAYLRFVVNPRDEISLRRVINVPARGIGTRSVARIGEYAKEHGIPFTRAFERAASAGGISGIPDKAQRALAELRSVLDDCRAELRRSGTLHVAARNLVERIGLREALDDTLEGGKQGVHRYQNVLALIEWLRGYEERAKRNERSLQDFLQRVTLNGDSTDEEETGPGVTLCTLHAAKGLEFSVVFLIGCVEGQLPHSRTTDPRAGAAVAADLDEERRLFYVGITRARDRLYLVAPAQRTLRGKTVEVARSRYMDELPGEHLRDYVPPEQEELSREELGALARELLRKARGASPSAGG
jgi:DNA helicase-2/ATP-dependent DNA helicase PcrA